MSDLIDRKQAIDAIDKALSRTFTEPCGEMILKDVPSAQPEQTNCDYCHEDVDGFVTPLEKNCHAFVRRSPIDGWILSIKYGSWRKDVPIRFCPMCGRKLKNGK